MGCVDDMAGIVKDILSIVTEINRISEHIYCDAIQVMIYA